MRHRYLHRQDWARGLWAGLALAAAMLTPGRALAQVAMPEIDLKAQILMRSLLFVEWPADMLASGQPIVVCVAETLPAAEALERQAGQVINGRRLLVRRTTVAGLATCQVAWVSAALVATLKPPTRGLLLVCDATAALEGGAMINLQTDQDRIVFDVNLQATRQVGMDISTRLLRLARFVRRD